MPSPDLVVTSATDTDGQDCATDCTLRQAINAANAAPGPDLIRFAIGDGPQTIRLASPLPTISESVSIYGDLQPGFSGTPLITLDGTDAGPDASGLVITGGTSLVRGLIIDNFDNDGIQLQTSGSNWISGNLIGIDADSNPAPNGGAGVAIDGTGSNTVGGDDLRDRNVISANGGAAVSIHGSTAWGNKVMGDYLGTDRSGTSPRGNGGAGVQLDLASNTIIGGDTPDRRNVISANAGGVRITGDSSSRYNVVEDNYIGTTADGSSALGNSDFGVLLQTPFDTVDGNTIAATSGSGIQLGVGAIYDTIKSNRIGTDAAGTHGLGNARWGIEIDGAQGNPIDDNVISDNAAGGVMVGGGMNGTAWATRLRWNRIGTDAEGHALGNHGDGVRLDGTSGVIVGASWSGNTIAHNAGRGVALSPRTGNNNTISANAISDNAGLGIDLGEDGVTPNDAGDEDGGPNSGQNFPTLSSATASYSNTNVEGTLNSRPNTSYRIDVFASPTCSDAGNGDGARYLGSTQQTTDDHGDLTFSANIDGIADGGDAVTATATDLNSGDTSEFSPCKTADLGRSRFVVNTDDDTNDGNCSATHCSLREAIAGSNMSPASNKRILFDIPGAGPHVIHVLTDLPPLAGSGVLLDGTSQPGYDAARPSPMIELDGSGVNGGYGGLWINGEGGHTVRGLAIHGFSSAQIIVCCGRSAAGSTIVGNYIGLDATGAVPADARGQGMDVEVGANVIGGPAEADRNVISGNQSVGVGVVGQYVANQVIENNYIGTDPSGRVALPNGAGGIDLGGNRGGHLIRDNVISGNDGGALGISDPQDSAGTRIQGNRVGTSVDGDPLGNSSGISVRTAGGLLLGGSDPGDANTIAYNHGTGITVDWGGFDAAIVGNRIFGNAGLGIDLPDYGVTDNDPMDADQQQNYPAVDDASLAGDGTHVSGSLSSAPNTSYRIEFFSSHDCDATGYGEGERVLGTTTVTTGTAGDAAFSAALPATDADNVVTATATRLVDGRPVSTSEFSKCRAVSAVPAAAPPGQPRNMVAAAGDGTASVSWSPPADDGGAPITGYTVSSDHGASTQVPADTTTATLSGLDNGTPYRFSVTATNSADQTGTPAESDVVTPEQGAKTPITASVSLTAGGTASTDPTGDGPTAAQPLTSAVTVPSGSGASSVTIAQAKPSWSAPAGYSFLGEQVDIHVLDADGRRLMADPANPLKLEFDVDASALPAGGIDAVEMFRDKALIPACVNGELDTSDPDAVCIVSRQAPTADQSYGTLTVLSTHASEWNMGVKTDTDPPSLDVSQAPTGSNGWFKTAPARVHAVASDPGIDSLRCTIDGQDAHVEAAGSSKTLTADVVTSADGRHEVSCTAMDATGNTTTRKAQLLVDTAAPAIRFSGNSGSYTVDQTVAIRCSSSDAVSGVGSDTCTPLNAPAYAAGLGRHTVSATATDVAGNTGRGETTYTVQVTPSSLCNLTRQFVGDSAAYRGLASGERSKIDADVCKHLDQVDAKTSASSRSGLVNAYKANLNGYVARGYLTKQQAITLAGLADGL